MAWVLFLNDPAMFRQLGRTSGKWEVVVRWGLSRAAEGTVCYGLNVCAVSPPKFVG